jgi:hypothetical protein
LSVRRAKDALGLEAFGDGCGDEDAVGDVADFVFGAVFG